MISKVLSAVIKGIDAVPVTIETDISGGLPGLTITGMADVTIKEAAVRVKSAILNSGLTFPRGKISISITPAEIRKTGSALDLGIAVGILAASQQILTSGLENCLFAGELSLDGSLLKTSGILNICEAAKRCGKEAFVPYGNRKEACLTSGSKVHLVNGLKELEEYLDLKMDDVLPDTESAMAEVRLSPESADDVPDFSEVKGQEAAKRALVIAAAGGHGVLMIGGPSSGKTMLAERVPGIMPPMTTGEMIRATEIYSAAGLLTEDMPFVSRRPFRRPHHTVTRAGLVGGGNVPKPGEITLAAGGILFLDEFAEMDPRAADALREPLEQKQIVISRSGETYVFPSDFLLIAASNPCRCGYYGDPERECTCTPGEILRYRSKLSGPVLERIDIHLELKGVLYDDLEQENGMTTAEMRDMVIRARKAQRERFSETDISLNSEMTDRMIAEKTDMDYAGRELLRTAYGKLKLNPRSLTRTIKVARTIADVDGKETVGAEEIGEALQYSRFAVGMI